MELALLLFTMGSCKELRSQIAKDESSTYEGMQASLRRYQAGLRAQDSKPHEQVAKGYSIAAMTEGPTDPETGAKFKEQVEAVFKGMQNSRSKDFRKGSFGGNRVDREAQAEKDKKENRCFWCHSRGHIKAECNKLKRYLERKPGSGTGDKGQPKDNGQDVSAVGNNLYQWLE